MQEYLFFKQFIYRRVEVYVNYITTRLKNEENASKFPNGRASFAVIMMKEVVRKYLEWVNERIRIDNISSNDVTEAELYWIISVLFWSQLTVMPMGNFNEILHELGVSTPTKEQCEFLPGNVCAFNPCLKSSEGGSWHGERYVVQFLNNIERLAY